MVATTDIDAPATDLDEDTGEIDLEQFSLPDALVEAAGDESGILAAQIELPADRDIWS